MKLREKAFRLCIRNDEVCNVFLKNLEENPHATFSYVWPLFLIGFLIEERKLKKSQVINR